MIDVTKVKSQILYLIKKANDKTEKNDADLTQAVETLVDGYYDLLMADTVKFDSEHVVSKTVYAMPYNWFADVVSVLQNAIGEKEAMDANDILECLRQIRYIPQASAYSYIIAPTFSSKCEIMTS